MRGKGVTFVLPQSLSLSLLMRIYDLFEIYVHEKCSDPRSTLRNFPLLLFHICNLSKKAYDQSIGMLCLPFFIFFSSLLYSIFLFIHEHIHLVIKNSNIFNLCQTLSCAGDTKTNENWPWPSSSLSLVVPEIRTNK